MRRPRAAWAAVLAFAGAAAGCEAPRYESGWNQLRVGMSRTEVESMLGHPSSTYVPPPPAKADPSRPAPTPARGERWQYGDGLSSLATRAVFPEEADERAWCVFFAPDGTVSGFRPPSWSDARSVDPPSR